MFNMIYSSETSFLECIFKAEWDFRSLFKKTFQLIKKDIKGKGLFKSNKVFDKSNYPEDSPYMFSLPIKDGKIDWKLIDH